LVGTLGVVQELLADRRRVLVVAVAVLALLVLGGRVVRGGNRTPVPPPVRVARAAAKPKASALFVDVVGAVRRPGLYRVAPGSRIADAVRRAGGPTPKAQLELVNLAALLADGEQVVVPRRGAAVAAAGRSAAPSGPVHLNSATIEQLDELPGVGPVTAQKIVDYRTAHGGFSSVDELDAVPGIGPARLADLRAAVAP
jgi:competence protein ComEA